MPGWPDFSCGGSHLAPLEEQFLLRAGEMLGAVRHLGAEEGDEFRIEIIREEAIRTSRIEGEFFPCRWGGRP